MRLCCIWGTLGAANAPPLRSGTRLLSAWRPLCWSACWLETAACCAGTMVVGGAPALVPVVAAGAFAEACWDPLPSSDLADSDFAGSDLVASGLVEEDVDSDDVLDVVEEVDEVEEEVLVVEDDDDGEDVAPPVAPLPVVALPVKELSVVVKELSRELITETLVLLIRLVPSLGRVDVVT